MQTKKSEIELLIENLEHLLNKGNAHASLDKALENISLELLDKKPGGLPYSIWQLAEHIRLAQWDILEFSRNPKHVSPGWPEGYWPSEIKPDSEQEWEACVQQIKSDRNEFVDLLKRAGNDIYKPFEHGDGQSLLKEALVLADHNAYHAGEIIIIRRLLNDWGK
jgi:hypothetical protein